MLRLARYQVGEVVRPGLIDDAEQLRDLSYVLADITPAELSPDDIDILSAIEPETLPPVEQDHRLVVPITGLGQAWIDGEPMPLTVHDPDNDDPVFYRADLALAGVVGAPGWVGAWMLARVDWRARLAALGPWLTAPDKFWRLDKLRDISGRRIRPKHRGPQAPPASAQIGDLAMTVIVDWPIVPVAGLKHLDWQFPVGLLRPGEPSDDAECDCPE